MKSAKIFLLCGLVGSVFFLLGIVAASHYMYRLDELISTTGIFILIFVVGTIAYEVLDVARRPLDAVPIHHDLEPILQARATKEQ